MIRDFLEGSGGCCVAHLCLSLLSVIDQHAVHEVGAFVIGHPAFICIDKVNTCKYHQKMDIHFTLDGTDFVWDDTKAASNLVKHDGISFEQAATVFFDPFFRLVDAERNDEARDAIIGFDGASKLLFVVHIQQDEAAIRIISARKATNSERYDHEHF